MNKKSFLGLIITSLIWIITLLIVVLDFNHSKGYSIFWLIILPITLLVYLGNYYDSTTNGGVEKETTIKKGKRDK